MVDGQQRLVWQRLPFWELRPFVAARLVPVRRASVDTDGDSGSFQEGDLVRVESDAIEEPLEQTAEGSRWITSEDSELLQVPSEDLRRCAADGDGDGGWRLLSPET
ncbi:unnamed protein product [Symbiodinium sp. CCMP2592]|nr:unnamed protein product [Symbiodinium sp. CCMP2592]